MTYYTKPRPVHVHYIIEVSDADYDAVKSFVHRHFRPSWSVELHLRERSIKIQSPERDFCLTLHGQEYLVLDGPVMALFDEESFDKTFFSPKIERELLSEARKLLTEPAPASAPITNPVTVLVGASFNFGYRKLWFKKVFHLTAGPTHDMSIFEGNEAGDELIVSFARETPTQHTTIYWSAENNRFEVNVRESWRSGTNSTIVKETLELFETFGWSRVDTEDVEKFEAIMEQEYQRLKSK